MKMALFGNLAARSIQLNSGKFSVSSSSTAPAARAENLRKPDVSGAKTLQNRPFC
jgi:hypothetical protein